MREKNVSSTKEWTNHRPFVQTKWRVKVQNVCQTRRISISRKQIELKMSFTRSQPNQSKYFRTTNVSIYWKQFHFHIKYYIHDILIVLNFISLNFDRVRFEFDLWHFSLKETHFPFVAHLHCIWQMVSFHFLLSFFGLVFRFLSSCIRFDFPWTKEEKKN